MSFERLPPQEYLFSFLAAYPDVIPYLVGGTFLLLLYFFRKLFKPRFPKKFKGTVTWVCDGDTFYVKKRFGGKFKVRLLGMDAPESEQKYGAESQEHLASLIQGKQVSIHATGEDIYGRLLAHAWVGKKDVSLEMIKAGMAWPYYSYLSFLPLKLSRQYQAAGESAKSKKKGLWKDRNPVAPWDWRKRHRTAWDNFSYKLKRAFR